MECWFYGYKMEKAMPKTAKKSPAKPAKKSPAKRTSSTKRAPATARTKAVTATPARVLSRRSGGKTEITTVIGSTTTEEIALRAYYIGERRIRLGLSGNAESDWLEAEKQLRG